MSSARNAPPLKPAPAAVLDAVGTPIREGVVVTYCGRKGSSMWLTVAVVEDAGYELTWKGWAPFVRVTRVNDGKKRPITLGKPAYVTVVLGLTEAEAERRLQLAS